MKILRTLLSFGLAAAMLLTACAPLVEPPEEPAPTKPVETPQEPAPEISEYSGKDAYITNPQVDAQAVLAAATANNAFALALYRQLAGNEGDLFYSPYSIYTALMMAYAGAAGETAAQMEQALAIELPGSDVHAALNALNLTLLNNSQFDGKPVFSFNVANQLWGQKDFAFNEQFLNTLSANYNADLKTVDFNDSENARALINLWVAAQTNDKIKDLIPAGVLNALTRLVLTNAVYFKAAWMNQFDPSKTALGSFTLADGSQVDVPMMHAQRSMQAFVNEGLEVVELPYEGGMYSMVLVMPAQGSLADFEASLDADRLDAVLGSLSTASVTLSMPKFKLESSFGLSETMKTLGMTDAFTPGIADFSGMEDTRSLYISDLLHKAYVDVNEEGTEAAAATAVVVGMTSMPAENHTISFDHPFLFLIRDIQTNTILFMGRLADPR
ncbi:MAG: serpin family protein [Anaerolineaceae bacterium]